ncbi:hypothetical protein F5141DRAFT_1001430, partial [Pisolithus sp. B1]
LTTRCTLGVSMFGLSGCIVLGCHDRDFNKKVEKMGHAEPSAVGSDFDDKECYSRSHGRSPGKSMINVAGNK